MGEDRVLRKRLDRFAIAAVVLAGLGCGFAAPASAQSISDRFKSLFGGKSDEPAQGADQGAPPPGAPRTDIPADLYCPPVQIRAGASTYAVGLPGKEAVGRTKPPSRWLPGPVRRKDRGRRKDGGRVRRGAQRRRAAA